jgi:predicted ATPase
MLQKLRLRNFKSWEDTGEISLRPITGFFGANSSGKTSLLQALLLLKQTTDSPDRGIALHFGDAKTLIDLGDFASVTYQHLMDRELKFSLDWETPTEFQIVDPTAKKTIVIESRHLGFSATVRGENGGTSKAVRMVVPKMEYRVAGANFELKRKVDTKPDYELNLRNIKYQLVRSQGRPWPLPGPVKCYGFPDQVRAYYQNAGFLSDLELAFEEQMRRIYYLGPLRAYPERRYSWAGAQPSDMGRAGDQAIDAILASRDRGELLSRGKGRKRVTLEQYVASWLKNLGLIAEFRVAPVSEGSQIFQVLVRKMAAGPEALITDVGFGVSQILPVVVLCFYVPEGSTVILEQPEIHLHPAVQANLADVLIDAYKTRNVQIIVESHSEHLLRRLQRRIAESEIDAADVALYFCEAGMKGSSLTRLEIDLFGQIRNWPPDFFGDQFGELAATQKARLARQ